MFISLPTVNKFPPKIIFIQYSASCVNNATFSLIYYLNPIRNTLVNFSRYLRKCKVQVTERVSERDFIIDKMNANVCL